LDLRKNKTQKNGSFYILGYLLETNHENMAIWDFFFPLKSGEFGRIFFSMKNALFLLR